MSHIATAWAYRQPVESGPKFVLVALADFADEAGTCYPGQERIADMTGMHRSSVVRHLKSLETSGLISRQHRQGRKGQRTSDRYVLHLSNVAPSNVAESNVGESNVASDAGPMSHPAQNQRRTMRQEPSVEPPENRQSSLSRRRPQIPIPDDWQPNALHGEQARARGVDVHREAEAFRNHAESVDRRLSSWDAGFRTWLTKARTQHTTDRQGLILRAEMERARAHDANAARQIGAAR